MVEQPCTTKKIRKLLIDPHAFASMLGNESCEGNKEDEESKETLTLVKEMPKIETDIVGHNRSKFSKINQNKTKEGKKNQRRVEDREKYHSKGIWREINWRVIEILSNLNGQGDEHVRTMKKEHEHEWRKKVGKTYLIPTEIHKNKRKRKPRKLAWSKVNS